MTKLEFGRWLWRTRRSLKMSQEHLAKTLGMKNHEVAKIEEGVLAFPTSKVKALALSLKVEKKFILEMTLVYKEADSKVRKAG